MDTGSTALKNILDQSILNQLVETVKLINDLQQQISIKYALSVFEYLYSNL